jgi:pheromone shutdown protein TraB
MEVPDEVSGGDPRITGEHLRRVNEMPFPLTLVGVVHDHPASKHRVRALARACDPAILALELPPLAVPLFEDTAVAQSKPTEEGGEMTAAIDAVPDARTVGIDGPSGRYLGRLVRNCVTTGPAPATLKTVVARTAAASKQAAACRFTAMHSGSVDVDGAVNHEVDATDSPLVQAQDEDRKIRQAKSFAAATGGRAGRATAVLDRTREQHMAARLSSLCTEGAVIAVVGIDHLDAIVSRVTQLSEPQPSD